MPVAPRPSRPLSPWPVGAAILGAFVALSIILRGSYTAVQVMFGTALAVGLALSWRRSRPRDGGDEAGERSEAVRPALPTPTLAATAAARHWAGEENLPPVLTLEEAATYLRMDATVVLGELDAGRLPGNRIGSHWRIRSAALIAWLDHNRH
ncbi:helix-turn-helix domain-containing protein [Actinoplanes sp. NPDC049668]|uniref:helix-turn-helix domain-containing protein n=1 Tax=unclassified Actinoplanes TaxID=2626549 RepID=UPI0033BC9B87